MDNPRLFSITQLVLVLAITSATVHTATSASLPCPKGLKCARQPNLPKSQRIGYEGNLGTCFPARSIPLDLNYEWTIMNANMAARDAFAMGQETPFLVHYVHLLDISVYNVMAAFHPTWEPVYYSQGYGLPFQNRISGEANNTVARNTAMAYSWYTVCSSLIAVCGTLMAPAMDGWGLDTNHTSYSNFTDPRDLGVAVGLAILKKASTDGWNMNGEKDAAYNTEPFSDYTGWVPSNSAYQIDHLASWQPLLESHGDGFFQSQAHVTSFIAGKKVQPFGMEREAFFKKYSLPTCRAPWNIKRRWTSKDKEDFKSATDEVIAASAALTDRQKMASELFDSKILAFGGVPTGLHTTAGRGTWNVYDYAANFMGLHGGIVDTLFSTWNQKLKFNAVRPASAIHYLYPDTNITAYAGVGMGTRTFPGGQWQSYLRTMPHADFPSYTACVCQAYAEFMERALGTPGKLFYQVSFKKGCSMKEPGVTPAEDLTLSRNTTKDFIKDCTATRLWSGVHFQKSIDAAVEMCKGTGAAAYEKLSQLLAGTTTWN
eukprot:gene11657-34366_t